MIEPDWFAGWFDLRFPSDHADFTAKEVAAGLDCSTDRVYRAIRSAELDALQYGGTGTEYRVPRVALRHWLLSVLTINMQ